MKFKFHLYIYIYRQKELIKIIGKMYMRAFIDLR